MPDRTPDPSGSPQPHRTPRSRRALEPLETPVAPVLIVGTVLFAVALLAVAITRGPTGWIWICLCGIALGGFGVPVARRMQRPRSAGPPLSTAPRSEGNAARDSDAPVV